MLHIVISALYIIHIKSQDVHQHFDNNDFQKIAVNVFEILHVRVLEI